MFSLINRPERWLLKVLAAMRLRVSDHDCYSSADRLFRMLLQASLGQQSIILFARNASSGSN